MSSTVSAWISHRGVLARVVIEDSEDSERYVTAKLETMSGGETITLFHADLKAEDDHARS